MRRMVIFSVALVLMGCARSVAPSCADPRTDILIEEQRCVDSF